jgi:5-(carboxyamino)imidazole ribonucleotide mutase
MKHAADLLEELGIAHEARIVSAHRTPDRLVEFSKGAADAGFHVIIAGAGGAAHLPGMIASMTALPVLGVPVRSKALSGLDSLLSIVQMPAGVPVGTLAIGEAGAKNAGLMAAAILALQDKSLAQRLANWRAARSAAVGESPLDEGAAPSAPSGPEAEEIERIVNEAFGSYEVLFDAHGWPERGSAMVPVVQARIKEAYGSLEAFFQDYPAKAS